MGHCGLDGALRDRKQVGTGCPSWSLGLVRGGRGKVARTTGTGRPLGKDRLSCSNLLTKKERKEKKKKNCCGFPLIFCLGQPGNWL